MTAYDVLALGETMIRLTPPGLRRVEQSTTLEMQVGGSESNTSVGLSRLGLRVCWLSRLTDNPLGRFIADTLSRQGVDTAHILWTKEDRVGLYFVEEGRPPRGSRVIYDRKNSAMSMIQPEHLDKALFQPDTARLLHITGITFAISKSSALTAYQALELGKRAAWPVSFDLNYRANLWSETDARACYERVIPQADILFAPLGDVQRIFAECHSMNAQQILAHFHRLYPRATVVLTLSSEGAIACVPDGEIVHQPVFPAETVDRVGGGDAFSAGFLYGRLTNKGLAASLRWAAACAALKYTIPGDLPLFDFADVERLVNEGAEGAGRIVR